MMVMMKIGKDIMTLPRLDVFCGGLVITKLQERSELKLDTKLFLASYASKHMCKVRDFVPFFFRLFLRARKAMMMKTIDVNNNLIMP